MVQLLNMAESIRVIQAQAATANQSDKYGTRVLQSALNQDTVVVSPTRQLDIRSANIGNTSDYCVDEAMFYALIESSGSNTQFGDTIIFKLPHEDLYYHDMVLELTIDSFGGSEAVTAQNSLTYFYADYPGVRLTDKVSFKRNNEEMDSYTSIDAILYRQLELAPTFHDAWDRAMGQSVAQIGRVYNPDSQIYTEVSYIDGPQTRKTRQPTLTLMIPLLFTFALDNRASFFAGGEKYENMTVQIETCASSKLFFLHDPVTNRYAPLDSRFVPRIMSARLHVNTRTVPTAFVEKLQKTRTTTEYRRRTNAVYPIISTDTNSVRLIGMNYTLEAIYVGIRDPANANDPHTWHRFGIARYPTTYDLYVPSAVYIPTDLQQPRQLVQIPMERVVATPLVDRIGLKLLDIEIARLKSPSFYNRYIQTRVYGGVNPSDPHCYAMYFSNRDEQGGCRNKLDLSTKNTLYVIWDSTYSGEVELVISAITIRTIAK